MNTIRWFAIAGLLIFVFGNVSCQKNNVKKSPIDGTWVETIKRTDTIVFAPEYDGQNATFELKRGFRISGGYTLPDYFSGPYWYKLSGDNISLNWFASSSFFKSYYFELMPDKRHFLIGNFFKNPEQIGNESDTLVFIRIE